MAVEPVRENEKRYNVWTVEPSYEAMQLRNRWLNALTPVLLHRWWPAYLAGIAFVLTFPSLWAGWAGDDYHIRFRLVAASRIADRLPEFAATPLDLFRFASGDPDLMQRLMDVGLWPWWTLPELRACFWRPIAAATHWLDFRLWPDTPALMHLHSIVWFAGLVSAVAVLFRRIMGVTFLAGLAALLYAVDDARTLPAAWLANRNTLPALLFGVLTIYAYDRWRRDGWRIGAWLGPVLLCLSLLSKEAGVATCAYLFAHALFLDSAPWKSRLLALLPYGLVVLAWRVIWSHLGYGLYGADIYVDPLVEPVRFIFAMVERVPAILLGQWFLPPSDVSFLTSLYGDIPFYAPAAAILITLIAIIVVPRLRWDATTKFWALGMMLSVVPICAAFPGDRLLGFVGLGASALIAQFLCAAYGWRVGSSSDGATRASPSPRADEVMSRPHSERSAPERSAYTTPHKLTRWTAHAFVVWHLVLGPITLAVRSAMPLGPPSLLEGILPSLPAELDLTDKSVIVVTSPVPLMAGFLVERRAVEGLSIPAHTCSLAPYQSAGTMIRRVDERTLVIEPVDGYLAVPFDRLARNPNHPFRVGQRIELTAMTITITSVSAKGRPAEAAFTFSVPLEDPSLIWLHWAGTRFEPFTPPAVGETVSRSG